MVTLEQVERLREKANVGFEDAKAALEATDGDILNALIYLEKQGKVAPPAGGGYYSSQSTTLVEKPADGEKEKQHGGESFAEMMKRFGRFLLKLIDKGNNNYLEAERKGAAMFSIPVTVVVAFLLFFFWIIVPLFILSLFFGFRYHFRGSDLGKESVNRVMDGASDTVDEIKKSFGGENK
ncbi:MAG: ubiquitin [Oscillospiraceae bacterium]